MATPVRFPHGVTNAASSDPFRMLPFPDPTKFHIFHDDFDDFAAAEWTITTTEAGAGDASEAVGNQDGGVLVLTNDNADNDRDFLQWSGVDAAATVETFRFTPGKKLWFKARLAVSDATETDFVMGLQITDTTPLAVSDGVYFIKNDGDAEPDFVVVKDSTATTTATGVTMAAATFYTFAFYYNGTNAIEFYVNDVKRGTSVVTNLPDDEELTVSFGIQNGEAAVKTMSIDYIFVAKER